ncbi:ATP-binding protein [Micromonospora sp. NPDC048909]|uniref:ATP-binding protein n=1 Tax=Micromonospora sp. NPDC048909 TaxID=3155643 RepID=UPI0034105FC5
MPLPARLRACCSAVWAEDGKPFLAFNAAGALVWGTGTVVLGYLPRNSYSTMEKTFGRAAALIILAIAVAAVITWRIRRHPAHRHTFSPPAEPAAERTTPTDGVPGSGLGLPIVAQAVELHGGTVTPGRSETRGTLLTVRLPAFTT